MPIGWGWKDPLRLKEKKNEDDGVIYTGEEENVSKEVRVQTKETVDNKLDFKLRL